MSSRLAISWLKALTDYQVVTTGASLLTYSSINRNLPAPKHLGHETGIYLFCPKRKRIDEAESMEPTDPYGSP